MIRFELCGNFVLDNYLLAAAWLKLVGEGYGKTVILALLTKTFGVPDRD